MTDRQREAVFISHAAPEDNTFVLWLGAKLATMGYDVWADIMRLRGGDDWARKLEDALRNRSKKVLFVGTPSAACKQGVRNEIQIASETAQKIGDKEFIIPLRLAPYEAPFLVVQAQYIDFSAGWAVGLKELVETLDAFGVSRNTAQSNATWIELQMLNGRPVVQRPERLISNWLTISKLPPTARFYDFSGSINHDIAKKRIRESPMAAIPFQRGFLSFAEPGDLNAHFTGYDLQIVDERSVTTFLADGWKQRGIEHWDASKIFVDITRQSIESYMRFRGLSAVEMASKQLTWWGTVQAIPAKQVSFNWDSISGSRLIQGFSKKRQVHWHYGVSLFVDVNPTPHIPVIGRLVFSEDGHTALGDVKKAHRLRRSFAKAWRNARWRDMMLAFLYWLADGESEIVVPTGSSESMTLALPPMTFESPLSVSDDEGNDFDEDDPTEPEWESLDADLRDSGDEGTDD